MSIFDRRPRLRWAVPAVAGAVILAGAAVGASSVSADSGLPPVTADELLASLLEPQTESMSGTVVSTADLGLPELPSDMAAGTGLPAMLSGTNTFRVWLDGPERTRVALLGDARETDLVRNGNDVWMWSSSDQTVEHYVVSPRDDSKTPTDAQLPSTPQEAAVMALDAIEPSTEVTTTGAAKVAGRSAYQLVLTPKDSDTLVARVTIAMDAETNVPLRVQVFSTEMPDPAYEVGFTSVDFSRPAPDMFDFTPPPGATVTDHTGEAKDTTDGSTSAAPGAGPQPTVVGTGWSQVVVADLPADALAQSAMQGEGASSANAMTLLESLPRTSGDWGSGYLLAGTLFSAILTDDGRIAVGAVTPKTLAAALAAQ
jgi:outer membrane lipoprotein-sorting protein